MILRNDNAEERLTPIAYKIGLVDKESYDKVNDSLKSVTEEIIQLTNYVVRPNKRNLAILEELGSVRINKPISLAQLLARPEINYGHMKKFGYESSFNTKCVVSLEIKLKYAEFVNKLQRRIKHVDELDSMVLDDDFQFSTIVGLKQDVQRGINRIKSPQYRSNFQNPRFQAL